VQLRQQPAGVRLRSLLGALLRFWWEKRIVTIVYTTGFLSSTTNLLMSCRVQARFNGTSRVSDKILDNAVDHVNRLRNQNIPARQTSCWRSDRSIDNGF
jgi:hypothetical protein